MKTLLLSVAIGLLCLSVQASEPDWRAILGTSKGELPPAATFTVSWRTNLTRAMAEARDENRPVFVTFRCLPCKQCSAFDKAVLEGGPDLDPLLTQFITIRLTDAADIDLRLFPVEGFADLDLSWWGWFLSPEGRLYGVFGGRDEVSDATRISKPALATALRRVLAHHYDPRRPKWDIDGPAPELSGTPTSPRQLPGYEGWLHNFHEGASKQTCIHCHQVNDILRMPAVAAKTFDRQRDFDVWPLPENVGLTVDRDDGLRVTTVEAGSSAEKAGLKPGDVLGAAGGRRLFGQADFRGVLHRGPRGSGEVEVWWLRGAEAMPGKLAVAEGWRKTVLDWRMSVSQGIVGAYPGFFPIAVKADRRERFHVPADKMAVEPFMGKDETNPAYKAGLRGSQIVTAVNGQSPNLTGRAFLVWFIRQFDPGDRITLRVMAGPDQTREVAYELPPRGQ